MTRSSGTKWVPKASELAGWDLAAKLAQQAQGGTAAPGLPAPQHIVAVSVVNTTGDTLPHLGCVGFEEPAILPTDDESQFRYWLRMKAVVPATGLQSGILLQDLEPGAVGMAMVSGVTAARVTGSGDFAIPTVGDPDKLTASESGWSIVWQQSGTSERWCVISLGAIATSGEPWLAYFKILVEGGPVGLSFDWSLTQVSDSSVVASGSWNLGDSFAAMKSAIETAVGETVEFLAAGPLPDNEVTIHVNRPFGFTKYQFWTTNIVTTPVTDGLAWGKTATCYMPGG